MIGVLVGVLIGVLLGALNVGVVAVIVSLVTDRRRDFDAEFDEVVVSGSRLGAVRGKVTHLIAPRRSRTALLAVLALGVVLALATTVHMQTYVAAASLPAILAALGIERWNRRTRPAPIPVATAYSIAR